MSETTVAIQVSGVEKWLSEAHIAESEGRANGAEQSRACVLECIRTLSGLDASFKPELDDFLAAYKAANWPDCDSIAGAVILKAKAITPPASETATESDTASE